VISVTRLKRSEEEVAQVREEIMNHAIELMYDEGYEHFSMRKLGKRQGIAAKTLYNYFHSQDELYLNLLIRGFNDLYKALQDAVKNQNDPWVRLAALIHAYIEFGLTHAHIYDLMFTWHVPKHNDYVGTPMAKLAEHELVTALRNGTFIMEHVKACLGDELAAKKDVRVEMIHIWSQMHGFVSTVNNTTLDYVYHDPRSLKHQVVERIFNSFVRSHSIIKQRTEASHSNSKLRTSAGDKS
jgi:AcrR family transcriptional regulator